MQQNQKTISSIGWLIGGIGFAVAALIDTIGLFSGMWRGGVATLASIFLLGGDVVALIALFTKKRDILLPIGLAAMSLGELVRLFRPFTGDGLFAFLAFLGICAIAAVYFTTILPENVAKPVRDYGRALWFAPAAIFATAFLLRLFFGRGWDGYSFATSLYRLFLYAPVTAFVAMWIIFPEEKPAFDFSIFKKSPAPAAPQQPYAPAQQPAYAPVQQPVQPAPEQTASVPPVIPEGESPFASVLQPQAEAPAAPDEAAPVFDEVSAPDGPTLTTQSDLNIATQLKVYQELLTDGIITPEEYEAKRKQILGL